MIPSQLIFFWTTIFSAGNFLKLWFIFFIVLTDVSSKYCFVPTVSLGKEFHEFTPEV